LMADGSHEAIRTGRRGEWAQSFLMSGK